MPDLFRASFNIDCPEDPGLKRFAEVEDYVRQWCRQSFALTEEPAPGENYTGPAEGERLRTERGELEQEAYFHLKAERAACTLNFWLTAQGNTLESELALIAPEGYGRPMAAPRFLIDLLNRFSCSYLEQPIKTEPIEVAPEGASAFAEAQVFSPERRLPLLLVMGQSSRALQWARADWLAGIARVAVCADNAVDLLNKELNPLHCFGGTVRLFLPNCSKSDRTWLHPFWPSGQVERLGLGLLTELRENTLAYLALRPYRVLFDEVSARVRSAEQKSAMSRSWQQAEQQVLDHFAEHERELTELVERYKSENEALKQERYQLLSELNAYRTAGYSPQEPQDAPPAELEEFRSVKAVIEWAEANLSGIRFLPSAYRSAGDAPNFPNRNRIQKIFKALSECAVQRKQNSSLGQETEDWFQERGHDYASRESATTMNKFGAQRIFRDNVRNCDVEMPAHFKLGAGGNALRIHVHWEDAERVWLVGHVGKHLDTVRG